MPYPLKTTKEFMNLIAYTLYSPEEFPHLRTTVLAQLALESGWGTSDLAKDHRNYAGMKWREMMYGFATPVSYAAHDGRTSYCRFISNAHFWRGYWHRLDMLPAYDGWRENTATGDSFINFIGPIWLGMSREKNKEYVQKIFDIRDRTFGG